MDSNDPNSQPALWKRFKITPEKWPFRKGAKVENGQKLREYRYLNSHSIDSYVDQLGGPPPRQQRKKTTEFSATGVKHTVSSEESLGILNYHAKIQFLIGALAKSKQLSTGRIPYLPKYPVTQPPFVHEYCEATPFIIPLADELTSNGLTDFRVWVSAPDKSDFSDEDFKWSGSYLILTELHFDSEKYHHFYSGCSALRFVVNAASGAPFVHRSGQEDFGRFDDRSMVEKLLGLGARQGEPRQIETLYRIRYMTDEQYFSEDGDNRRVHDILGYPLFISVS